MLELEGCLVSIDAAGTQVKIANGIIKKKGDYLLAVKKNQPSLCAEVEDHYQGYWDRTPTDQESPTFTETYEEHHGRKEHRRCWVLAVDDTLPLSQKWQAPTLIAVQAGRTIGKKTSDFVRFYISSRKMDATAALKATRNHWSVENNLHWALDIAFKEDQSRIRNGFAGENMAVIRQWILNMLKQNKSRSLSMASKRKLCGLNDVYLFECRGLFKN
jgi:predicted transposase YbfD/YdcC